MDTNGPGKPGGMVGDIKTPMPVSKKGSAGVHDFSSVTKISGKPNGDVSIKSPARKFK
jgi:hypothetical protein